MTGISSFARQIAAEISKDLVHEAENHLRAHVPSESVLSTSYLSAESDSEASLSPMRIYTDALHGGPRLGCKRTLYFRAPDPS
jgi:hypothetical protein